MSLYCESSFEKWVMVTVSMPKGISFYSAFNLTLFHSSVRELFLKNILLQSPKKFPSQ